MDRLKVPVLGIAMPKVHIAFVKYGMDRDSVVSEKWVYRAHDLYRAYDTTQKFSDAYPHGMFSYLPPWHLTRILPASRSIWWRLADVAVACFSSPSRPPLKPKLPVVELVSRLPPDQRVVHWRRLDRLGAFS